MFVFWEGALWGRGVNGIDPRAWANALEKLVGYEVDSGTQEELYKFRNIWPTFSHICIYQKMSSSLFSTP